MYQKLHGGPHPDTATSFNNIGEIYHDQGQYAKALEYHQRNLAMCQKLYTGPDVAVATCLNNIGRVYHNQRQYAQALNYLQQSLAMYRKLYAAHTFIATSLNKIGDCSLSGDKSWLMRPPASQADCCASADFSFSRFGGSGAVRSRR
jgi:tetratricopeptide (TPR) repeat protein